VTIARSIARPIASPIASRTPIIGGGGGGTPEITSAAMREYLFEPGSELVDTGLDASNATNVNSVTFSGGVATFTASSNNYLSLPNSSRLANLGRDVGYGVELEFLGLSVTSNGARQLLFGSANDLANLNVQVLLESTNSGVGETYESRGLLIAYRTEGGVVSRWKVANCYTLAQAFDLQIVWFVSANIVRVYVDGVERTVTTVDSGSRVGSTVGWQYPIWLGNWGRGTPSAIVSLNASLDSFQVKSDGIGQADWAQLDVNTKPFNSGTGYNTYRIPALIASPDYSTLLCFCEGRASTSDDGEVDIVVKRSTDGGATWGSNITVADDGNTNADPCPVYDANGRLHCFWVWRNVDDTQAEVVAGTASEPMRVYHSYSDDDGSTWSTRADITSSVAPTNFRRLILGADGALLLADGRIICAGAFTNSSMTSGIQSNGWCFYSDDEGVTFEAGDTWGPAGTSEVALAQVGSTVIFNHRDQSNGRFRLVTTSTDGGETVATATQDVYLPEPRNHAGMCAIGSNVYFINTAVNHSSDLTARVNLVLRRGTWNGTSVSWSRWKVINPGLSGYSKVKQIGPSKLGVVWEDGSVTSWGGIKFQSFDI